jgi:large subunit ribosomal protein L10
MNREQKTEFTEALAVRLASAPLVVLADYRTVTVSEINAFRRTLEAAGIEYRVVKNTLARLAIANTPRQGLNTYLTGMTGMVISGDDPIAAAKLLRDITKDFRKAEKFVIKGGYFDGQVLDGDEVQKVADLPSREELLSQLLRTVQEGPRQLLGVLQAPARDLLYLLRNHEAKLAESEA